MGIATGSHLKRHGRQTVYATGYVGSITRERKFQNESDPLPTSNSPPDNSMSDVTLPKKKPRTSPAMMASRGNKIEITPEMLQKVEDLAAQGLNQAQIARCLGMSPETMTNKKKESDQLLLALKKGAAKGLDVVTNALFESAQTGNITAQIFYLKNRAPEDWRDAQQQAAIQINLGKLSDTQLLDELRDDPALLNLVASQVELPAT